uniref:Uncharacterized protein n=1 Tax=Rhizophora mucronata TaxID=61149 RepID=A0A2P2PHN0_RHIMU
MHYMHIYFIGISLNFNHSKLQMFFFCWKKL